jgi:hypothetical protein
VEDATSGVESIRAAGYRLVIGVDRADQRQALIEHGADIVVRDLGELQLVPGATPSGPICPMRWPASTIWRNCSPEKARPLPRL